MARPEADTVPPSPALMPRLRSALTWAILLIIIYISAQQTDFTITLLFQGAGDFFGFFTKLLHPDWRALKQIWRPLIETLQMAYLGTIFGTLLAAPLIFMASYNTSINETSRWIARSILTILRSIPDLLYAALLVPVLSIGPLSGIVALTLFTMAVLSKLGSETVEAIDPGPLEALRATGAGRNQVIVYGALPQIAATMTSYILYAFEINVRASVVLGLVGAGGIGVLLFRYLGFFDYAGLSVLIIVTFAAVLLIDSLSTYVRSRLI